MTEQEFTGLGVARVDEEELAEAVRTHPILYDKSIKEFKDQKKKENAWKKVAVLKYWTHPLFSSSNFFTLSQRQQAFLPPYLKSSFHLTLCLYVSVHITAISDYVVMSLCCYVVMLLV